MEPTLLDLLPSFLRHLAARNLSPRTVRIYDDAVRRFVAFGKNRPVGEVERHHIETFIQDQILLRSASTANTRYRGLTQFFKWARDEGEVTINPMAGMRQPKVPEIPVETLTPHEMKLLLGLDPRAKSFTALRDHAILRLFAETGMRLSELAGLTILDVDLHEAVAIVMGKGGRPRYVPFGPKAATALDRYLRVRARHAYGKRMELWLGKGGAFGASGIAQMVRNRGRKLGISVHPHQFRHTFAHSWLSAGGNEGDLMRLCGWRSREMLGRYGASAADDRARAAYRRFTPEF